MRLFELDHQEQLEKSGGVYWGKRGAGILPYAQDTGEFCFVFRSEDVHPPSVYGCFGGAIDGNENPKEAALREFKEESHYNGSIKLIKLPLWVAPDFDFSYQTYLGVIPKKFEPKLNWENDYHKWVSIHDWPQPLIQGLKDILTSPKII